MKFRILLTDPNRGPKLVAYPFRITWRNNLITFDTPTLIIQFVFVGTSDFSNFWMFFEYFDPDLALYLELRVQIWHV